MAALPDDDPVEQAWLDDEREVEAMLRGDWSPPFGMEHPLWPDRRRPSDDFWGCDE